MLTSSQYCCIILLQKLGHEEADIIAILPPWPRRDWFLLVLIMFVGLPVLLPVRSHLIKQPALGKLSKQWELLRRLHAQSVLVRDNLQRFV